MKCYFIQEEQTDDLVKRRKVRIKENRKGNSENKRSCSLSSWAWEGCPESQPRWCATSLKAGRRIFRSRRGSVPLLRRCLCFHHSLKSDKPQKDDAKRPKSRFSRCERRVEKDLWLHNLQGQQKSRCVQHRPPPLPVVLQRSAHLSLLTSLNFNPSFRSGWKQICRSPFTSGLAKRQAGGVGVAGGGKEWGEKDKRGEERWMF